MTKMKEFNSQVCTTKEQSQRLLELGLKPETADMKHFFDDRNDFSYFHHWECFLYEWDKELVDSENIPAWSLHRLIEIAEVSVEVSGLFVRISSTYYYEEKDNVYDNLIDAISELINNEVFNKEYLKQ